MRDFYHTCYCLSGLSVAQHFYGATTLSQYHWTLVQSWWVVCFACQPRSFLHNIRTLSHWRIVTSIKVILGKFYINCVRTALIIMSILPACIYNYILLLLYPFHNHYYDTFPRSTHALTWHLHMHTPTHLIHAHTPRDRPTRPAYNIRMDKVQDAHSYFSELPIPQLLVENIVS